MLALHGVKKAFGGSDVLHGVDLEVRQGELFSIVGPSGCGKSTLLRIVAGLDRPDEGQVRIDGNDVARWEPADRGVGMVFQNYALFPHLSVGENIGFGLKGRVSKAERSRRVAEVAELLELDGAMLKRRPRQLSGGQRQRVALGRALIRKPRLLLMDEPLSGADALLRERMRSELRRFHDRAGTTTLYVTHDQREAMSMSDRLMVLDSGRVQQVGRPVDVYRRPATAFAARFLGAPGMNVWSMPVHREGNRCKLYAGDEQWRLPWHIEASAEQVLVGIRPEHVRRRPATPGDLKLRCRVGTVEPLGEQALLHAWYGESEIVAKIDGDFDLHLDGDLDLDGQIDLWLSPMALHLFSTESGQRLENDPEATTASHDGVTTGSRR